MRAPGSGRHDWTYRSKASRRGASASRWSSVLGGAVLASLLWLSVPPAGLVHAQTNIANEQMLQANMAACGDRRVASAKRIPRCNLVIRSGLLDAQGLEQMLLVRCEAYEAASDHASALRDCDRALEIAPKDFHAYDERAAIYGAQSKFA